MSDIPKSIAIIGGGTAGWITASILQHAWADQSIKITLIESPNIPTIGVGEGSTPALRKFFSYLKITEKEWMPKAKATYKVGISFKDWSSRAGFSEYFHPFYGVSDAQQGPAFLRACEQMRAGQPAPIHAQHYFLAPLLSDLRKAPSPTTREPINHIDYGYHFDAGLLAEFLKERLLDKGLTYIRDDVDQVVLQDAEHIQTLRLRNHEEVKTDFYIDCTGFASLLHQKALGAEFKSYSDLLLNNSAVTIPTPHTEPIKPITTSTALSAGWAWQIPLTSRIGNGYVYSLNHISADKAEAELRDFLKIDGASPARHLKMKVGRVNEHWKGNCLAVGLSQGFIEPLEATALALVQSTVENFVDAFDKPQQSRKADFNQYINDLFDGIRDYILTHYLTNSRQDTAYWQDTRDRKSTPEALQQLINAWKEPKDFMQVLHQQKRDRFYKAESWYALLSGVGYFNQQVTPPRVDYSSEDHPSIAIANTYFAPLDEKLASLA